MPRTKWNNPKPRVRKRKKESVEYLVDSKIKKLFFGFDLRTVEKGEGPGLEGNIIYLAVRTFGIDFPNERRQFRVDKYIPIKGTDLSIIVSEEETNYALLVQYNEETSPTNVAIAYSLSHTFYDTCAEKRYITSTYKLSFYSDEGAPGYWSYHLHIGQKCEVRKAFKDFADFKNVSIVTLPNNREMIVFHKHNYNY